MGWLLGDWKFGTTRKPQLTPGGRSFSNSKDHSRSLIQRPLPLLACASLQVKTSGAGAFASPKFTALSLNLATTCRTRATSFCGDTLTSCSAYACRAKLEINTATARLKFFTTMLLFLKVRLNRKNAASRTGKLLIVDISYAVDIPGNCNE